MGYMGMLHGNVIDRGDDSREEVVFRALRDDGSGEMVMGR